VENGDEVNYQAFNNEFKERRRVVFHMKTQIGKSQNFLYKNLERVTRLMSMDEEVMGKATKGNFYKECILRLLFEERLYDSKIDFQQTIQQIYMQNYLKKKPLPPLQS